MTTFVLAFVMAFAGSMPIAGPIALLVVARAGQGRGAAARTIALGAALAEGCYAATAFLAFAALLGPHASVAHAAHGISAVLLIGVGGRCAFFRDEGVHRTDHVRKHEGGRTFLLGLWISILNPTLLVTWSTAVAFLDAKGLIGHACFDALPFGVGVASGVVAWNVVLVKTIVHYHGRLPRRAIVWAVRGMGVLVAAVGLWSVIKLVVDLRNPS